MNRAVKGREQLSFVGAADQYAARPGDSEAITAMMRLACEGVTLSLRQRASDWLFRTLGVRVIEDAITTEAKAVCI